jgi:hypothetical protein
VTKARTSLLVTRLPVGETLAASSQKTGVQSKLGEVMTTTEFRAGGYSIQANSKQTYTFWWPHGGPGNPTEHKEYFDVSIAPTYDGHHSSITPLVEVQREVGYVHQDGVVDKLRNVLSLTLQNNNPFEVKFLANHVRVH